MCGPMHKLKFFSPFNIGNFQLNVLVASMFLLFPPILDRIGNSLFGILFESLVFWEQKSKSFFSKSELLSSLFFKEGWEQISSFTKSKKSDEERFNLLYWASKGEKHCEKNEFEAIHSFIKSKSLLSLFTKMTFSPVTRAKRAKKGRTEEKIPNPDSRDTLLLISHYLYILWTLDKWTVSG